VLNIRLILNQNYSKVKMLDFLAAAATLIWTKKYSIDPNFKNYIRNILKQISPNINNNVLYIALYYMNRLSMLCVRQKEPMSEYRVFVVAMILADIQTSDNPYSLSSWEILSGFQTKELISMRREFLQFLKYDLNIQPETFRLWLLALQELAVHCAATLPLLPNVLGNSIHKQSRIGQYPQSGYIYKTLDTGMSTEPVKYGMNF
jgi:hypothetical protein